MKFDDFCNLGTIFVLPGQPSFHMAWDCRNTKHITDAEKTHQKAWVWVSFDAFGIATFQFVPLAEFVSILGADNLDFVKNIWGMSDR